MIVKCLVGKGPSDTSYGNWSKDAKHRKQAKIQGIFEGIWPENNGPLPWRLTKEDKQELEERMANCVWPHYMEALYYKGPYVMLLLLLLGLELGSNIINENVKRTTHTMVCAIACVVLLTFSLIMYTHTYTLSITSTTRFPPSPSPSCRSLDVVQAQPNVEIKAQVPPFIFHAVDTTAGQGPSRTPSAIIFCVGNATARWAGTQPRSRPTSRNLARVTICEERWSGQHTQGPTPWDCLTCGSIPKDSFESGTQAFRSLHRVYEDAFHPSNSVDDGF